MTGTTERQATIRAVLYLRQHASPEIVQTLRETVARVRRLEEEGLADVKVKTWASVSPALEELSDSGPSVSLTVNAFQAWANREGYTLRPAFAQQETTSLVNSRPTVTLQVPIRCLAVYEDGDLHYVAPCSDGERTYTVEECLAGLEAGFTEPFAFHDRLEPIIEDSKAEAEKSR